MRKSDFHLLARYIAKHLKTVAELETLKGELKKIQELLDRDPEAVSLLNNPFLSPKKRVEAIQQALTDFSPLTHGILSLLVRQRAAHQLSLLLAFLDEVSYEKRGELPVTLSSPETLPAEIQEKLRELLEEITGKRPVFTFKKAEKLLGGFLLEAPGYRMDATMRGLLKQLEEGGMHGS